MNLGYYFYLVIMYYVRLLYLSPELRSLMIIYRLFLSITKLLSFHIILKSSVAIANYYAKLH